MKAMRVIIVLFVIISIFAFGLLMGTFFPRFSKNPAPPQIVNTATVLKQIQTLSQLVTVRHVYEKVVILEDVKWYGESRVLFVAHGNVKAGVDLEQLKPEDISVSGERISVTMPKAILFDVYLDDHKSQVVERSTGLMRTFDKDLEQNARRQAVTEISRAARLNGIEKEAEQRARDQLMLLFHQFGFKDVEIKTRP
ncbi:MAG: DUF4230 domain-containing protein [Opitutaceae bacterium]|nr:DUF4230 domain-containing protein [Verrucomicrobiales bacterium]